jgi:glyoxylase-like metal-dependent hydrolase (beta-lactamase superfamily II)
MHPEWLSNAYVVGDEVTRLGFFVDSGAPLEPLIHIVEREKLEMRYLLTTHGDADHIAGHEQLVDRFDLDVIAHRSSGVLRRYASDHPIGDREEVFSPGPVGHAFEITTLYTPGHKDDHLTFVANGEAAFTGDVLFKDAVGGGNLDQIRSSVMDVLMKLPPETRVLPGHTDETTIGREWEQNPFVRVWRGEDQEGTERVRVDGREATLVVWSPDYDGKGKAWVRFDEGEDAIVGGSRVGRG